MLHFGMKTPFSFEAFIEMCGDSIVDPNQPTLKKWYAFDGALRNALVKIRSARKHVDATRYLRRDADDDPSISHLAMNAYKNPSILESEKMLDEERWHFLSELEVLHFFDIDFLVIYAQKLLILEKWEKINTIDKARALEEVLAWR